jgi:ADP-heptose:LPS heptosyltransferase
LKKFLPHSEITLIGLPWAEQFVERFSDYFSDFIEFPGYPGLPEQGYSAESFCAFLNKISSQHFDLVIQMHGNGSIINPMVHLFEGRMTAGYCQPDDPVKGKYFMTYPDDLPEVERHLSLMKFLGVPYDGKDLEFPIMQEEELNYHTFCRKYRICKREYVCIHAGARDTRRWWSPEKFARVGDEIAARGYKVVLTGTMAEKETVDIVEDLMTFPAINLAGKTNLGTLAVLIREAKMIVSNDTGVSHIAAAVKTPSVVIFLASDPMRWAPLNRSLHHIILPQEADNLNLVLRKTKKVLLDEEESDITLELNDN